MHIFMVSESSVFPCQTGWEKTTDDYSADYSHLVNKFINHPIIHHHRARHCALYIVGTISSSVNICNKKLLIHI